MINHQQFYSCNVLHINYSVMSSLSKVMHLVIHEKNSRHYQWTIYNVSSMKTSLF